MPVTSRALMQSLVIFIVLCMTPHLANAREVVGWVEKVALKEVGFELRAKIDSGAKTTSLHCECSNVYEKDGEQWVSFVVANDDGDQIRLERKVERIAKIKRHFGEAQERIVIKLGVCLANVYEEIEVNVIDRSGLNYQMLIGRNFLANNFLIDSGATFTKKPNCSWE